MILVCRIMCIGSLATDQASPRIDQRLGDAHRLGVGERLVQLMQRVRARADLAARGRRGVALEERQRPEEVAGPRCPSSRGSRDACG